MHWIKLNSSGTLKALIPLWVRLQLSMKGSFAAGHHYSALPSAPLASVVYLSLSQPRQFHGHVASLRRGAWCECWCCGSNRVDSAVWGAIFVQQGSSARKWACDPLWRLARAESFCRRLQQRNRLNGSRRDPTRRFQVPNQYRFWATSISSCQGSVSGILFVQNTLSDRSLKLLLISP